MISKGFLTEARELARDGVRKLAPLVKAGRPILGVEPSCLLTLADEWPDLVPGEDARAVARAAHMADAWLASRVESGEAQIVAKPRRGEALFHGHCHQKALTGVQMSVAATRAVLPDLRVLDAGCCGMAGSFGYEHFDVSVQIANLELVPAIAASPDAELIATGTSCRHQIKDLTGRTAKHPLEVIAEGIEAAKHSV